MEINTQRIIQTLLRIIHHISDTEYQKRVWIRAEGPEVDDFDETCNWFFDVGDPVLESYKEYGITDDQYQVLKDFRDKFEAFSDENSWPPFFIDTPKWARIVELAKEVLKVFEYKLSQ